MNFFSMPDPKEDEEAVETLFSRFWSNSRSIKNTFFLLIFLYLNKEKGTSSLST